MGARRRDPFSLPWPDWAGRQRKRKGLEDSDIVSLVVPPGKPSGGELLLRCPQGENSGQHLRNALRRMGRRGWESSGGNRWGKVEGAERWGRQRRKGEGSGLELTFHRQELDLHNVPGVPTCRKAREMYLRTYGILVLLLKEASPGLVGYLLSGAWVALNP